MNHERHRLVTRADCGSCGPTPPASSTARPARAFDEIARDYGTRDACQGLLVPDPPGTTSRNREAAANTAHAQALVIEDARGRRGGELDSYVDLLQILDPKGWIVPRRLTPEVDGEWKSIATPGGPHPEVMQPQDFPTTGFRP